MSLQTSNNATAKYVKIIRDINIYLPQVVMEYFKNNSKSEKKLERT